MCDTVIIEITSIFVLFGNAYRRFSAIVLYHCTSFEENEFESFAIFILDVSFIRDLRISPELENMSIHCK